MQSFRSIGKIFLILLLLCSASISFAASKTILIIGDSLSAGYGIPVKQGWVQLLRNRLAEKGYNYRVINASISGDTSSNGLARTPALLKRYRPQIVILELGGNDGLRGISPAVMQNNLSAMVVKAQKINASVLLIGVRLPPNYGPAFIKQFVAVYRQVAKKHQISLVPQFLKDVGGNPKLMQRDGIHPNAKAQIILLNNVWPTLEPLLKSHKNKV